MTRRPSSPTAMPRAAGRGPLAASFPGSMAVAPPMWDSRFRPLQIVTRADYDGSNNTWRRGPMKTMNFLAVSAIAVSICGFATIAQAQNAGKLFISSDMERGNQAGAPPACVLNNVFIHLEKVVWRVRVQDQNGNVL